MIECADEEGIKKLGICEAHETIRRVAYYSSVKEELLERLRSAISRRTECAGTPVP